MVLPAVALAALSLNLGSWLGLPAVALAAVSLNLRSWLGLRFSGFGPSPPPELQSVDSGTL